MSTTGGIPWTRRWGLWLALVAACISGVAVYLNSSGVAAFEDATVYTTVKNGVAAAFLVVGMVAAGWRSRRRAVRNDGTRRPASPMERAGLVAVAIVGGSLPFVLFFEGLARASATEAAFLHKTLLVWVALLAVPLLRERLSGWHVAAVALLVAGQAAATGDVLAIRPGAGELMILAATLLWAVELVLAKRLLSTFGSLTLGTARLGLGLAVLVGWLGVTGRIGALAALTPSQWGWGFFTGAILAGFVASWYAALARAQAVDVTAVLVFAAVITAALAGAFDGLVPGGWTVVGLVLIGLGTAAAAVGALRGGAPVPERIR